MTDFSRPIELLKHDSLKPKKALGQHFLLHQNILQTIATKIFAYKARTILEIGPGPASLTQFLAKGSERLVLVEKDKQFESVLKKLSEMRETLLPIEIYWSDFLEIDLSKIITEKDKPAICVGNLPYNVSVPILLKLLHEGFYFETFVLMFQREVAERLLAKPATKAYGSLSVWVQMQADVELLVKVPASAFFPKPKVESALVAIRPIQKPRVNLDRLRFQILLEHAFNPRRKMLQNTLLPLFKDRGRLDSILKQAGIDSRRRGETLTLDEFLRLELLIEQAL